MRAVLSKEEFYATFGDAKNAAPCFVTNIYPKPEKLEAWIARGSLFELERGRAAIWLRRDADFYHVLFAAAEPSLLPSALQAPAMLRAQTCVSDLIGRPEEVSRLVSCFETAGFRKYKTLRRLAKLRGPEELFEADPRVCHGTFADAGRISEALQTSFDRHAEQIPALAEIQAAVAERQILVLREGPGLLGFLHFEAQGQTATVRYWFVSETARGRGVGSGLMRTFFSMCPHVRRAILWVLTTNENAIVRYGHYGFKPEALVDQVMINKENKS